MANHSCGRKRPPAAPPPPAVWTEPEVRRWPHPVTCTPEPEFPGLPAALHYLHCSLSYQNQLLSEIRALLESLCAKDDREQRDGK